MTWYILRRAIWRAFATVRHQSPICQGEIGKLSQFNIAKRNAHINIIIVIIIIIIITYTVCYNFLTCSLLSLAVYYHLVTHLLSQSLLSLTHKEFTITYSPRVYYHVHIESIITCNTEFSITYAHRVCCHLQTHSLPSLTNPQSAITIY